MIFKYKYKSLIIFFSAIILMAISTTYAQNSELITKKVLKIDNVYFTVKKTNGLKAILSLKKETDNLLQYAIPIKVAKGIPVAFDIRNGLLYSVSVFEPTPLQYSFKLVKCPLEKLALLGISNSKEKLEEFESVKITPLQNAYIESQIKESGPIYYDILISENGKVEIFIQQAPNLISWILNDNNWIKNLNVVSPLKGQFYATAIKGNSFLFSEDGGIYNVENQLKKIGQFPIKEDGAIIFDADKQEVKSSDSNDLNLNKLRGIFKSAIKIF